MLLPPVLSRARSLLALTAFLLPTTLTPAQQPLDDNASPEFRTTLEAGIAAFKAAHYAEAVASFRKATQLDPGNETAHLYLGTTLAYEVVPNLNSPENLAIASSAIAEFDIVLKTHPDDLIAIQQEAAVYRDTQQLDKAMELEQRVTVIEPTNAEALYTIGVIDWTQAYKNAVTILAHEGLADDGQGNVKASATACQALRAQNESLVEDGISSLTRAIELKPGYEDAMLYLNLVYRRRADLHCANPSEVSSDLRLADQWQQKAMSLRKQASTPPK